MPTFDSILLEHEDVLVRIYNEGTIEMLPYDPEVEAAVMRLMGVEFEEWGSNGISVEQSGLTTIDVPLWTDDLEIRWRDSFRRAWSHVAARRLRT